MKLVLTFLLLTASALSKGNSYPLSDHYDGKTFHNPGKDHLNSFWDLLKWRFSNERVPFPESVPIKNYPFHALENTEKLAVTFINHSTVLLQLPGLTILTDPIYSNRTSPVSFAGPERVKEPGLPFENLPAIDVVLVSHNHYDHLDIETLKRLDAKFHPLFLVSLGDEKLLLKEGIQNVKAMDWWEELKVKDVRFTFAPSQHWSARTLWDKNNSLWGSFMVDQGEEKIYFAGDTGLGPHFKEIKERLGKPTLSLLPIGSYKPQWFMRFHHLNPEDAVVAHQDLESKKSIAIHYGTFQLSDEGIDEPVEDLKKAMDKHDMTDKDFLILDQGQTYSR